MRYEMRSIYSFSLYSGYKETGSGMPACSFRVRTTNFTSWYKRIFDEFLALHPFTLFSFSAFISVFVCPSFLSLHLLLFNTTQTEQKTATTTPFPPSVLFVSPSPSLQTFLFFFSLSLYFTHSFFLRSRSLTPTTGVLRASNQSASERLLFLERLQPSGREMQRWREEKCT